MKKIRFRKYTLEFLSIFIAVVSAFALNNWNDNRRDNLSEEKILKEINNGIELDFRDFRGNIHGHKMSLKANQLFRDLLDNKKIDQDSIDNAYIILFRDYTPIINRSGYESLKASGLEKIKNDSLRFEIISLYDFYYTIIYKLEVEIPEMKSYTNYFKPINDILHPYMIFNKNGRLIEMKQPVEISESQKKEVFSYLWRLETNRKYKLARYKLIEEKMKILKQHIKQELKQ
ncbi:DUF6090 family protein [Aquimarina sp. RZ0]|uniref:DUF6090 family protein n=1 Tax=Aquimarina sp. RZ0 TaxID=2607730 RepID=UPI0011F0BFE6|nr:DUF6090 family protein [Aquimarina sp. RZ0]KAA1246315.1 hypothetical protein F0000_08455 [Aquimarina sp. RZ0]